MYRKPVVGGDVTWKGKGIFGIGEFSSLSAGLGQGISSSRTKAFDVCADDMGMVIAPGNSVRAGRRRMLVTAVHVGDVSIFGGQDHLKVSSDLSGLTGFVAGGWAYMECSATAKTAPLSAGHKSMVDLPSGAVIPSGGVLAGYMATSNDLGGTHTGKAVAYHVPNPVAGTWDAAFGFGSAPGGITVNTHSIDSHALSYIISVKDPAGNIGYIPVLASVPS